MMALYRLKHKGRRMKKSKIIKEIVKVLQPWESSRLDKKCAEDILTKLEELGMELPLDKKMEISRMSTYFICDSCAKKKKLISPKYPVTCTSGLCGWCKRKDVSSLTPICDFDTKTFKAIWD